MPFYWDNPSTLITNIINVWARIANSNSALCLELQHVRCVHSHFVFRYRSLGLLTVSVKLTIKPAFHVFSLMIYIESLSFQLNHWRSNLFRTTLNHMCEQFTWTCRLYLLDCLISFTFVYISSIIFKDVFRDDKIIGGSVYGAVGNA